MELAHFWSRCEDSGQMFVSHTTYLAIASSLGAPHLDAFAGGERACTLRRDISHSTLVQDRQAPMHSHKTATIRRETTLRTCVPTAGRSHHRTFRQDTSCHK